jgi:hypothetical protein
MEHYIEHVVIETDRHRIVGSLRLPLDGYRRRVTDFLNTSDRDFLPVTDAVIEPLSENGEPPIRRKFLAVARRHIVLAMLADDELGDQPQADDRSAADPAPRSQTPP